MKKHYLSSLLIALLVISTANAQYVTIPDLKFRGYLKNLFPSCFNIGGQMDTTCAAFNTPIEFTITGANVSTSLYGLQFIKKIYKLHIKNTSLKLIDYFPPNPYEIDIDSNSHLANISYLPASSVFETLSINYNDSLVALPAIPDGVSDIKMKHNLLFNSFPNFPHDLGVFMCTDANLASLPPLTGNNVQSFWCNNNRLTALPDLSQQNLLYDLFCSGNRLTSLPALPPPPANFQWMDCSRNNISSLPTLTAFWRLSHIYCDHNPIPQLPGLPNVNRLHIQATNIHCLPVINPSELVFDTSMIRCSPRHLTGAYIYADTLDSAHQLTTPLPVCYRTNNIHNCQAFPVLQGTVFYDVNGNGIRDTGEPGRHFHKLSLSNNIYGYTNSNGFYDMTSLATGTFTLSPGTLPLFNPVPASASFTFSKNDTLVTQNFAYQPTVIKDTLAVYIVPIRRAIRSGWPVVYDIIYGNAGTTNLGATAIKVTYDTSKLVFDSASNAVVTQSGNVITLSLPSLPLGTYNGFKLWFRGKTGLILGTYVKTLATASSGAISTADSSIMIVVGSFDPNDKTATPQLNTAQVAAGKYIDYVVRFQNTGTDTAYHVVIQDNLSPMLNAGSLELISTSHPCRTTLEGNVLTFEFRNIMLPDSNVNEGASHGYAKFRVKPMSTVVAGNAILNKANIYFDYNNPVITNLAATQILASALPLKLVSFRGQRTPENNVDLQWVTNNEFNTRSFTVEQSSDGRIFTAVGEVRAIGTGSNDYTFTVPGMSRHSLFFRLLMEDKDGNYSYSSILLIISNNKEGIVLAQNPARNTLKMTYVNPALINTKAVLLNNVGAVVKQFVIRSSMQSILIGDLSEGVYYLQTETGYEKVLITR